MQQTDAQPQITSAPPVTVLGIARDYTMDNRHEIPKQWEAWFAADHRIDAVADDAMYGVSFSADGQGGFRYGVGVAVNRLPDPLPSGTCAITLSGGDYAVLRCFGPPSELPGRFDWPFSDWMPGSGFEPREGAVFERYPEDERNAPGVMAYEIWAPIARRA